METKDSYYTLIKNCKTEIKIKKSLFIAQAFPVRDVEEVNLKIKNIKKEYFDAKHHPYAYRIGFDGNIFRTNDDGEPSNSSGKPVLEVIDKFKLTYVLIVVTRYFGGVKLGIGGLRRAYFDAALAVINEKNIGQKYVYKNVKLEFKYDFINPVMNLIENQKIKIQSNLSDDMVKINCSVRLSRIEQFKSELINITNGSVKFLL